LTEFGRTRIVAPVSGLIGASVPRRDAPAKVTGGARHTDDLAVPGAAFGLMVRSAEPHAPRARTHIVKDEYQP
jgi:CO/xanthine dehydrogenase Mo-binding subunit